MAVGMMRPAVPSAASLFLADDDPKCAATFYANITIAGGPAPVAPTCTSSCPTCWKAESSPARVDRITNMTVFPMGYRAMNDGEAIKRVLRAADENPTLIQLAPSLRSVPTNTAAYANKLRSELCRTV